MAIDSYTALTASINAWSERSYAGSLTDDFIALFESAANRKLGPDYRRLTSVTVTTNSSGEAILPAGFVTMRSLTRDLNGSVPLKATSWAALIGMNPYAFADDARFYAIRGSTLKVAPVCEDDFIAVMETKLTGLSGSNASNWLLAESPNAYLFGCLAAAEAYNKNFQEAAVWEAKAMGELGDVVAQSDVAQFGNAELALDMVTP
jgi:hypothetical protein